MDTITLAEKDLATFSSKDLKLLAKNLKIGHRRNLPRAIAIKLHNPSIDRAAMDGRIRIKRDNSVIHSSGRRGVWYIDGTDFVVNSPRNKMIIGKIHDGRVVQLVTSDVARIRAENWPGVQVESIPDETSELPDLSGKTFDEILQILGLTTLEGANLQGANLQEADLSADVNMRGVNLRGANLQGAVLLAANLREADLRGVNFQGADLQGVEFQGADFRGADIREADLRGAELYGANLEGIDIYVANNADMAMTDDDYDADMVAMTDDDYDDGGIIDEDDEDFPEQTGTVQQTEPVNPDWYLTCTDQTDLISLETWKDLTESGDIKDPVKINFPGRVECGERSNLLKTLHSKTKMTLWVPNFDASRWLKGEPLVDNSGHGGHPLPNGPRFAQMTPYHYVLLSDDLLKDGAREYNAELVNPEKVRYGNVDGSFGVSEAHGQHKTLVYRLVPVNSTD